VARWRCAPDRLAATEAANQDFFEAIRASQPGTPAALEEVVFTDFRLVASTVEEGRR